MHELERKANKHFKVFTDYEKRQAKLEAHAVQLLFQQEGRDPNLPMIPSPQSARIRKHCYDCGKAFWGLFSSRHCDECEVLAKEEDRLENELAGLERMMRVRELKKKVRNLKKEDEELSDLSDELSKFSTP